MSRLVTAAAAAAVVVVANSNAENKSYPLSAATMAADGGGIPTNFFLLVFVVSHNKKLKSTTKKNKMDEAQKIKLLFAAIQCLVSIPQYYGVALDESQIKSYTVDEATDVDVAYLKEFAIEVVRAVDDASPPQSLQLMAAVAAKRLLFYATGEEEDEMFAATELIEAYKLFPSIETLVGDTIELQQVVLPPPEVLGLIKRVSVDYATRVWSGKEQKVVMPSMQLLIAITTKVVILDDVLLLHSSLVSHPDQRFLEMIVSVDEIPMVKHNTRILDAANRSQNPGIVVVASSVLASGKCSREDLARLLNISNISIASVVDNDNESFYWMCRQQRHRDAVIGGLDDRRQNVFDRLISLNNTDLKSVLCLIIQTVAIVAALGGGEKSSPPSSLTNSSRKYFQIVSSSEPRRRSYYSTTTTNTTTAVEIVTSEFVEYNDINLEDVGFSSHMALYNLYLAASTSTPKFIFSSSPTSQTRQVVTCKDIFYQYLDDGQQLTMKSAQDIFKTVANLYTQIAGGDEEEDGGDDVDGDELVIFV